MQGYFNKKENESKSKPKVNAALQRKENICVTSTQQLSFVRKKVCLLFKYVIIYLCFDC